MKISFCSIAFRNTNEPLIEIISRLAEVGYAGIEIWANHLAGDGQDLEEIRAALDRNRMSVPMIAPYFNITGSIEEWKKTLSTARSFFEYAKAFKTPLLRVFTGFTGSDEADKEQWDSAVDKLTRLCDESDAHGLTLALETHPKTLVDCVPAIHKLLADVDRPNLGLNLDIYHLWERHQDPEWIWSQVKPYVLHLHAKNAHIPPGDIAEYPLFHDKQGQQDINSITYLADGDMDYIPFLSAVSADSFDGWLSIEWFGADPLAAGEHELRWLNKFLP